MRQELDRMTRKRMIQIYARRYRKATTRREKTRILDEFTRLTGHNRSYASRLLRYTGGTRAFVVADPPRRIRRSWKRL